MNLEKNIKPLLGLIIILLSYIYFFAILLIESKGRPDVIIAIVAMTAGATGYYFGSSSGSGKKDETIAQQLNKDVVISGELQENELISKEVKK